MTEHCGYKNFTYMGRAYAEESKLHDSTGTVIAMLQNAHADEDGGHKQSLKGNFCRK